MFNYDDPRQVCVNCGFAMTLTPFPGDHYCPQRGWQVGKPATMHVIDKDKSADGISDKTREQIVSMVNETINAWLTETRGLPITLQLTKLGFALIAMLEQAYEKWADDWYKSEYE